MILTICPINSLVGVLGKTTEKLKPPYELVRKR